MKILLVEDEKAIAQPLSCLLESDGWKVITASTVAQAQAYISEAFFDAALVDLGLPDGSGYDVCKTIRKKSDTALLILTARTDEESVVKSLEGGADDYIEKPFRSKELIARLRAVLRRRAKSQVYTCADLMIDTGKIQVWKNGQALFLTAQEYRLLLLFLMHPGQVLERGQLLQMLWDQGGSYVNDNTLTVTVKRLRQKIEWHDPNKATPLITTVRGIGYRWEGDVYAQP